ncbi:MULTISPECIES: cardiolipin synthase [Bacillaceae]|uniref:Cardiolipin synthase n=1 Tax=Evansella alkalicola TaxID=745819 RepID=A0ABS6K0Z2_9BACI|nr:MULTISPECIES: cardiolipin synthase [Bacillaceae]MBU9724330.1 cardiolipin synthase [Bacillus alkalicola]
MALIIILILIIAWITVDIYLGYKKHQAAIKQYKEAPIRQSDAHFFSQGDKLYDDMFKEIVKAKDHIHMYFYIFRDDNIGKKMLGNLMEKARQGVTVRLMVDWIGSKISKESLAKLKEAGIQFSKANPPSFPYFFYTLNERNHRKITVIDGKIGYIGGYNIGDEYLGRDPKMGPWRDYHLKLAGEAVADLQKQYLNDWERSANETIPHDEKNFPLLEKGKLKVQIVPTNGTHAKETIVSLLHRAKKSVMIGTPYFIPGSEVQNALLDLVKKGVRVKVLIPKTPDHPLVKDAAIPYIESLLKAGVEIRQFNKGFYHSKVIIIDDDIVDIGTANFDKRSFHLNHEINCIISDQEWIRQVKDEIEEDFYQRGEEITLEQIKSRSFFEKTKEKVATTLSPLL